MQQMIDDPRGAPPHRPEHEQYNHHEGEDYPTEAHLRAEASRRGEHLRSPLINFHHLEYWPLVQWQDSGLWIRESRFES